MDLPRISEKTLVGKAIRLPLKLVPRGAVVSIVQGPARGKRWVSNAAANGYWLGYWELNKQHQFASRLKAGDVVYEIGAHVGMYMLGVTGKVGPQGHIYAFEPLPRNAAYLRRHVELNRLPNCTIVEAAVCNSSGQRQFDASVCHSEARLSEAGTTTVPAISLDEFVFGGAGRRSPNLMKIDARGAEMEIFCGGRRTLAEFAPQIFLSLYSGDVGRECRELLGALGYSFEYPAEDIIWAEMRR